jgi:predicted transcriptional regulator
MKFIIVDSMNRKITSFTIKPEQIEKLTKLAKLMNSSRSRVIEQLIDEAYTPEQAESKFNEIAMGIEKVLKLTK